MRFGAPLHDPLEQAAVNGGLQRRAHEVALLEPFPFHPVRRQDRMQLDLGAVMGADVRDELERIGIADLDVLEAHVKVAPRVADLDRMPVLVRPGDEIDRPERVGGRVDPGQALAPEELRRVGRARFQPSLKLRIADLPQPSDNLRAAGVPDSDAGREAVSHPSDNARRFR